MMHPFLFFVGYRVYSVDKERAAELIDLCRELGISYRDVKFDEQSARLVTRFFSSFALERAAEERGLELGLVESRGIPALLFRYRHRYGLFVGIVLSIALIALSGSVIWDIRIDGEESLSEREVRSVLADCGLELGTRRRSLDIDTLENRVLIRSDDIAWISVNIIGTVAEVEIRELRLAPRGEELPSASNLVAVADAKIVGLEDVRGNIAVEIGERVREGQLLVGGIYGDEESGFRYTNPEGRVLGEVDREFEVKIARTESKKVYTGEVRSEKYLIFFKKRIKFFSNCRNLPSSCDKIEVEEYLLAPRGIELPFGIYEVRYLEYEYEQVELSDEELSAIADQRMDTLICAELDGSPILRKKLGYEPTDSGLTLSCKIRCIQNIASRLPIEIDGIE